MEWLTKIVKSLLSKMDNDEANLVTLLPIILMFLALIFAIWVLGQVIMSN